MLTGAVNANAGIEEAPIKRFRCKSTDLVSQTQQHNLGKILFEDDTENQMVVQSVSNSGKKVKLRRKTPVRPNYNKTTATSFEILLTTTILQNAVVDVGY